MQGETLTAILSFFGMLAGSLGGILAANRMTDFRLRKLEEKVDRHNSVIERTYRLEEQMKVANHRIKDLEEEK